NHSLFGVADFYSLNFNRHGHQAAEFHINNPWLQYAWARENGLKILPLEPPPAPPSAGGSSAPPPPPPGPSRPRQLAKAVLRPAKRMLGPLGDRIAGRLRRELRQRALRRLGVDAPLYAPDKKAWEHQVLQAQIEHYRPDLILNQELAYLPSA